MGWTPAPRWDGHGSRWHVRLKGKHYNLGPDLATAHEKFSKLVKRLGIEIDYPTPLTVPELCEAWLRNHPGDWRRNCLRRWCELEAETYLTSLEADALRRYARHLEAQYSPQTIVHYVTHAQRVWQWGIDQGWIETAPKRPKVASVERSPRDLPARQVQQVFKKLNNPRAEAILKFIAASGCRPKEARMLRWRDVRLDAGVCELGKHKTSRHGHVRTIYLTADALGILKQQPKTGEFVFTSRLGKPYTANGLRSILRKFRKKKMGGIHITPYSLRHTFAQGGFDQGLSLDEVGELLGHADARMTRVYVQRRSQRAKAAAKRITTAISAAG